MNRWTGPAALGAAAAGLVLLAGCGGTPPPPSPTASSTVTPNPGVDVGGRAPTSTAPVPVEPPGLGIPLGAATAPDPVVPGAPATSDPTIAPGPPAALGTVGPDVAARAATLPTGPASGNVTVTYSGLGAVSNPATGTCTHDTAGTTTVALRAGTATVTVLLAPGGATLHFVDIGVEQRNDLAAGTYLVDAARLRIDTALAGDAGTPEGNLALDVTC